MLPKLVRVRGIEPLYRFTVPYLLHSSVSGSFLRRVLQHSEGVQDVKRSAMRGKVHEGLAGEFAGDSRLAGLDLHPPKGLGGLELGGEEGEAAEELPGGLLPALAVEDGKDAVEAFAGEHGGRWIWFLDFAYSDSEAGARADLLARPVTTTPITTPPRNAARHFTASSPRQEGSMFSS
jgi:hypothetical protein